MLADTLLLLIAAHNLRLYSFFLSAANSWHCLYHWKCHTRAILGAPSTPGMHTDTLEDSFYEQLFCVTPSVGLCERPLVRADAESFK